jgi:autotransporter-associated beta strand protein
MTLLVESDCCILNLRRIRLVADTPTTSPKGNELKRRQKMGVSKSSWPMGGLIAGRRSTKTSRMLLLASLPVAALPLFCATSVRANVIVDVPNGPTELDGLSAGATNDLVFTNITYSPTAFTLSASLTEGTLDDLDNSQILTISNSAAADTLTLDGGANSSGATNANDLLYVASGGSLSINGGVAGSGTIATGITLGAAGNLDVAGAATITAPLTSSHLITMTGGGTLTLGPASAAATGNNTLTGGFAIQNGTVNLGGATNEPEFDLGANLAPVTLGGSAGNNATLNFNVAAASVEWDMTIASTGTSTISSSASGVVTFLTGTFVLDNNLTVADTNAAGTLGFRNTITQSGGTYGITVGSTNVGTVNFQGASTYTGGVTIDAGTASFSTTEGSANPTSGPFGGGTVTLGGLATSSATLADTGNFNLGNPVVVGPANNGITRTITSATSSGSPIVDSGETMTLQSNLNVEETTSGQTFGLRNTIVQSGGTYGITVDSNNVGTIDFRGANTFAGGVTIDNGTASFNASSSGSPGSLTNGPFGTGTVTLGGVSTLAATLASGTSSTIGNSLVVGATTNGSARTITETSASSTAGVISGPITLNNDLTLTAVATTLTNGSDRLRVGSGGITGSNNIIINNLNNTSTSPTAKGPIRLDGTGVETSTWTGNLIVQAGLGSLGTGTAIDGTSANNTVLVASGASFDFASNTGVGSGFSPTIAGLSNYAGGGGTVFESAPSNNTLNLGGNGNYAFSGTIADSTNTGNTTALAVNLSSPAASQSLSGASTYSGGTTIAGGKLLVINLTGSATGSGAVALSGGASATLEGTGSSSGALTVSNDSLIAPGVNTSGTNDDFGVAGTLALGTTGGITLTDADLDFDLGTSATAPGTSDLITTGGTLTLGTVNFTFNPLGASLDTSNPYTLISGATGLAGSLTGVTGTVIGDVYTPVFSLSGDNLLVTFTVPEPTTLGLFGASSLMLMMRRRRKA